MSVRTHLLLTAIVFVAACGSQPNTADDAKQPAARSASTTRAAKQKPTSVFTPLTSTIDRAKSVQATVDKQAAKQRRQIEEESQ